MDKRILDELIKFGVVTNIDVDPTKYNDVDDLINKGIITIPGAKGAIDKLISNLGIEDYSMTCETLNIENKEIITDAPTISLEVIIDTPEQDSPIVDTIPDEKPLDEVKDEPVEIVEKVNEESSIEVNEPQIEDEPKEIIVDEVKEESVEETVVYEPTEETPKKKKTKKSE